MPERGTAPNANIIGVKVTGEGASTERITQGSVLEDPIDKGSKTYNGLAILDITQEHIAKKRNKASSLLELLTKLL